jgi:hypothetical protein
MTITAYASTPQARSVSAPAPLNAAENTGTPLLLSTRPSSRRGYLGTAR